MSNTHRLTVIEGSELLSPTVDESDEEVLVDTRVRISTNMMVIAIISESMGSDTRGIVSGHINANGMVGRLGITHIDQLEGVGRHLDGGL